MSAIAIDIAVEAGGWPGLEELQTLVTRTIQRASNYLETQAGQSFPEPPPELSVVFTDDDAIRALNDGWRGKDGATNVLSFPVVALVPGEMPGPMLGDIVLARETIAEEAEALGLAFEAHLTHLVVHGFLHLLGYDHIDADEAAEMESLETRILATLGVSDPYAGTDPA